MDSVLVVGVGPATGTQLCRRLAGRYQLIMVARSRERIAALAEELTDARAFACDISDVAAWHETLGQVRSEFGPPRWIIFNAESPIWGEYNALPIDQFAASFKVTSVSLLQMVQALYPDKHAITEDTRIIVSSSPAAYDPPARFLGLAPSRVAQRTLVELLNESLAGNGLSLSVFSIDGAINEPKMRAAFPDQPDSFFIQPDAIAAAMIDLLQADSFPIATGISGESSFSRH